MRALVGLLLAGGGLAVSAAERNTIVEPRLTLAEIYTDNVDHDVDARRRSDLVTQALPGIAVARRTPHSLLQLDYQLEGLVYARGTHSDHVYQRLFGNLHTEPVPDWFDLDAGAIIGQTIIDAAGTLSTSNVVGGRNRTEVRTYTLAPAFDHRFRGVHVHAGVRWQATRYQRGASDSDGRVYDLRLSDADHLPFLHWNLSYLDQKYDRKTTTDVHFRNLEGQVRYRLFRGFHLVARAGRADNAYQGVDDRRNGNYWAAGAGWQGRRFAVDVLDGRNDKGVTLDWTPNVRTQVDVTYRNRKVGRVHGPEWRGRITHRTRHTRLGFLYQESTQSYEQLSLFTGDRIEVRILPGGGLAFFDPLTGDRLYVSGSGFFSLTDSVINRKRGTWSLSWTPARSEWRLALYRERRTELARNDVQDARGLTASLNWHFGARTDLLAYYDFQHSNFKTVARTSRYRIFSLGARRRMGRRSTLGLSYLRAEQDTSGGALDFVENRLMLSFRTVL